ncbi:MAG: tetratricopeptide repeat protein [Fimbriimonadaceae bacterium]|nr:tetratricopeptide repeat protein [Fimbriimonadaceae bacterium]
MRGVYELFHGSDGQLSEDAIARRNRVGRDHAESTDLGAASLEDGDVTGALIHFRRAVEQAAGNPELAAVAQANLAGVLSFSDDLPGATHAFLQSLRLANAAEPRAGLSDVYRREGRFRDAVAELDAAIALEPTNAFHHFKLAETLAEMGEKRRALTAMRHAIMNQPDNAFYHCFAGNLQLKLKEYSGALSAFRAAVELSPGDDYYYLRTAVAFWRLGKRTEAIRAIRMAYDLDAEKTMYAGLLYLMHSELGQPEDAQTYAASAKKLDAYDHSSIAKLRQEMGLDG